MKKESGFFLTIVLSGILFLSSCQAIGQIFSAGIWVGVIAVVVIVIILFWIFGKKSS